MGFRIGSKLANERKLKNEEKSRFESSVGRSHFGAVISSCQIGLHYLPANSLLTLSALARRLLVAEGLGLAVGRLFPTRA